MVDLYNTKGKAIPLMLFEDELKQIASINASAMLFLSFGSLCLSLCASLYVAFLFDVTPLSAIAFGIKIAIPFIGGMSVVFYLIGAFFIISKMAIIKRARKECMEN
jgi:hypothetical protein